MGKGVVAVHHHGGEDGDHLVTEPPLHLLLLLGVQFLGKEAADPIGPQLGLQGGEQLIPAAVQGPHRPKNGPELLVGGEAAPAVPMPAF